jgi:hypothetical protein
VERAPVSTTSKYGEASLNQCEVARETPTCSLSIGRRLTGMSQTAMKVSSWARPFGSLPDSLRPGASGVGSAIRRDSVQYYLGVSRRIRGLSAGISGKYWTLPRKVSQYCQALNGGLERGLTIRWSGEPMLL